MMDFKRPAAAVNPMAVSPYGIVQVEIIMVASGLIKQIVKK